MNANANKPAYRAYTVIKREAQSDFWAPIGAAFSHHDGLGLNVLLRAIPIDGKVVLRPAKETDPVEAPEYPPRNYQGHSLGRNLSGSAETKYVQY